MGYKFHHLTYSSISFWSLVQKSLWCAALCYQWRLQHSLLEQVFKKCSSIRFMWVIYNETNVNTPWKCRLLSNLGLGRPSLRILQPLYTQRVVPVGHSGCWDQLGREAKSAALAMGGREVAWAWGGGGETRRMPGFKKCKLMGKHQVPSRANPSVKPFNNWM